jgi:hypothetical protein
MHTVSGLDERRLLALSNQEPDEVRPHAAS